MKVNRIRLFIPIEPIPQGRPRFTVLRAKGGGAPFVSTYDPPECQKYKAAISKIVGRQVMESTSGIAAMVPLDQPLAVGMTFYLSRTRTIGEFKKKAGIDTRREITYKDKNPTALYDLDNLEKAVQDALNKVLWKDDKLICGRLPGGKHFAENGHVPGIEVIVQPFGVPEFNAKQEDLLGKIQGQGGSDDDHVDDR